MNTTDALVVLGGIAAILWVTWYFFFAGGGSVQAAVGGGGTQEVKIRVLGGYDPAHVRLKRGVPVRLVFDRAETSGCSEELVIPHFGIKKFLPANQETVIRFTPEQAGDYEFTCGMGMLRGRITVEDDSEAR
jgi:plastocyanin domain-containing protein